MPFPPESGDHTGALGVRRPVELPEADVDAADGLAPKASSAAEGDAGEAAAAGEKKASGTDEASGKESSGTGSSAESAEKTGTADAKDETEAVAQTVAVAKSPGSATAEGDGMPPDRPKKPVLAGIAIGGAVLLAIPILLIGTGSHHGKKHPTADAAATVLPGDGQQPPPGAYVTTSPSATPTAAPSATAKSTPKAAKSAAPKHSAQAQHKAQALSARSRGVPASELPTKGGNPYALEVHAPYDINTGKTLRTNRLALTMQSGGNLVLRDTSSKIIWSSGTHHSGAYAEFQSDGNLVVYINGRQPVWASGTFGHEGATLVLQADYNMVIFSGIGGSPIWATGTNH